jgi:hypothetical protein
MSSPDFQIVGLLGDPTLTEPSFDGTILTLNVNDTYEYLPLKIFKAFSWCLNQWPDTVGIFKTDDDIVVNINDLVRTVQKNKDVPYWGLNTDAVDSKQVDQHRINKFTDKSLKPRFPAARYCWGHGYYVSRQALTLLVQSKDIVEKFPTGPEDVNIGSILNKHSFVPRRIEVRYREAARNDVLLNIK